MKFSHLYNLKPKDLAKKIIEEIEEDENILKIEIAGPGFINFFISKHTQFEVIDKILKDKADFGKNNSGIGQKILIGLYLQIQLGHYM